MPDTITCSYHNMHMFCAHGIIMMMIMIITKVDQHKIWSSQILCRSKILTRPKIWMTHEISRPRPPRDGVPGPPKMTHFMTLFWSKNGSQNDPILWPTFIPFFPRIPVQPVPKPTPFLDPFWVQKWTQNGSILGPPRGPNPKKCANCTLFLQKRKKRVFR